MQVIPAWSRHHLREPEVVDIVPSFKKPGLYLESNETVLVTKNAHNNGSYDIHVWHVPVEETVLGHELHTQEDNR